MLKLSKLVLVRHGQSQWNLENRFTGWVDVPLSKKGIEEAISAGKKLKDYEFDTMYVSHMLRAFQTLHYIIIESSSKKTPIIKHNDKRISKWELTPNILDIRSSRKPFMTDSTMMRAMTPTITPRTEITVITEIKACLRLAMRYLNPRKSSKNIVLS